MWNAGIAQPGSSTNSLAQNTRETCLSPLLRTSNLARELQYQVSVTGTNADEVEFDNE